jgi:hypothetical protein
MSLELLRKAENLKNLESVEIKEFGHLAILPLNP